MKRDVNFLFFGLLILLLIGMVGVMLYSDYTYHKVNIQYIDFKERFEEAQQKLNHTRAELEAKDIELYEREQDLVDIINQLNLSKKKESSLSEYYTTIKSEKDTLSSTLSETEEELNTLESDYLSEKLDHDTCKKDVSLWKAEFNAANTDLGECKASVSNLSGSINGVASKLEEVMAALKDLDCNESSCDEEKKELEQIIQDTQTTMVEIKNRINTI